jgi:hypothetical protein
LIPKFIIRILVISLAPVIRFPEALEQMGYNVTLLTEKELARNNLKQFDAIISGVRAYNTNEWLNKYYDS